VRYDTIGRTYRSTRRPEPRWESAIWSALGDARRIVNVGAGTGSYEPPDHDVVAVEPSAVMVRQRPPGAAPCVRAIAESLPFHEGSFDAALAILTAHHWADVPTGVREMLRVAPRAVLVCCDVEVMAKVWLCRDYVDASALAAEQHVLDHLVALGGEVTTLPVPHDCRDGVMAAFWRRPEAYLDEDVRAGISWFDSIGEAATDTFVERLAADLGSGAWRRRNADLLELDELDAGYRLVVVGDRVPTP